MKVAATILLTFELLFLLVTGQISAGGNTNKRNDGFNFGANAGVNSSIGSGFGFGAGFGAGGGFGF